MSSKSKPFRDRSDRLWYLGYPKMVEDHRDASQSRRWPYPPNLRADLTATIRPDSPSFQWPDHVPTYDPLLGPIYGPESGLILKSVEEWDPKLLKPGVKHLEFGPDFALEDSHLYAIASASEEFRHGVSRFYCGDTTRRKSINITDEGVAALAAAVPYLSYIHIEGAPKLSDGALSAIGQHCDLLRALAITTPRDQPAAFKGTTIEQLGKMKLGEMKLLPFLKYLEFHEQKLDAWFYEYFEWLSHDREFSPYPRLEIVYTIEGQTMFWRGGFSYYCEGVAEADIDSNKDGRADTELDKDDGIDDDYAADFWDSIAYDPDDSDHDIGSDGESECSDAFSHVGTYDYVVESFDKGRHIGHSAWMNDM